MKLTRRDFIKGMGASIAGLVVAQIALPAAANDAPKFDPDATPCFRGVVDGFEMLVDRAKYYTLCNEDETVFRIDATKDGKRFFVLYYAQLQTLHDPKSLWEMIVDAVKWEYAELYPH